MQYTGAKPEKAVSVPVRIIHVIVICGRDYAKLWMNPHVPEIQMIRIH